jgi:IclR family pca regulon transcriptional regulator
MTTPLNHSLIKGLAILDLFSDDRVEITAATVTRELGMNSATAHRFLATLEEAGALVSLKRGSYALGHRMVEIGRLAMRINPLGALVQPVIEQISHDLNESVFAGRLVRNGVACIATASSRRDVMLSIPVGRVFELHATSHGKVWLASMSPADLEARLDSMDLARFTDKTITSRKKILAEIDLVRSRGYATNLGERESEMGAVAVPVLSPAGEIVLSMSVFGLYSRFDEELVARAIASLQAAAARLGQMLARNG